MRKVVITETIYDFEGKNIDVCQTKVIGQGWFHCFGLDCGYHEGQSASWTVAIVEMTDGSVCKVNLDDIRFLDKPRKSEE